MSICNTTDLSAQKIATEEDAKGDACPLDESSMLGLCIAKSKDEANFLMTLNALERVVIACASEHHKWGNALPSMMNHK